MCLFFTSPIHDFADNKIKITTTAMTLVHHTIQTATAAIALFDHPIQRYDNRYDKAVYVL
jgi:hypothetical protein